MRPGKETKDIVPGQVYFTIVRGENRLVRIQSRCFLGGYYAMTLPDSNYCFVKDDAQVYEAIER